MPDLLQNHTGQGRFSDMLAWDKLTISMVYDLLTFSVDFIIFSEFSSC